MGFGHVRIHFHLYLSPRLQKIPDRHATTPLEHRNGWLMRACRGTELALPQRSGWRAMSQNLFRQKNEPARLHILVTVWWRCGTALSLK
jgi:hypothetical protein